MASCPAKHTKLQVPDADFKCPKCGTTPDGRDRQFYIQEPCRLATDDCDLLHDEDELGCDNCGAGYSGKKFAALYAKTQGLVPCPACKGSGHVPGVSRG